MTADQQAGVFLSARTAAVDLGEHHGTQLTLHVQRRSLRLGWGQRAGLRIMFGRLRPTAVTLTCGRQTATLPLPSTPHPLLMRAVPLVIPLVVAVALRALTGRRPTRTLTASDHGGLDGAS